MRWRAGWALLIVGSTVIGCETGLGTSSTSRPSNSPSAPMQMTMTAITPANENRDDPRPQLNAMVHLDIYLLNLPAASVSENKEFWKRVDEEAVGTANAQRLKSNGIRCGVAPRSEGAYFSQFFDRQPDQARRQMVDGLRTDTIELDLEKKFDQQDLFFVNAANELEGRSYSHGIDRLALTFGPTPRDPGAVRLTLCPVVYSDKTLIHFSPLSQENEFQQRDVDRIYDAGLSADVPGDSFMIIAPGSDASRPSSLGGTFLIQSGKTEKLEQVILVVPTFLRLDGSPMRIREPLVKLPAKAGHE